MALRPDQNFNGTAEEYNALDDAAFAEEWRYRYYMQRAEMVTEVARWLRLLRFFHPRNLVDHWQDSHGNALPKLAFSEGLSVEIYNWCRPIIEVYGSLLAGQKPYPFDIDVPPMDKTDELQRHLSDVQEKIIREELRNQKIPLHFMDFCVSVVLFGIGYVVSFMDSDTRRLKTQSIAWPGDVLPHWGSDRYGRGGDGLESVIITERISLDTAERLYPGHDFLPILNDSSLRPDGLIQARPLSSTQILKVWWRWREKGMRKDRIGYAEIAFGAGDDRNDAPILLYRDDDTGYPDIPVRWASRFPTPGEAPHRSAGVLDDVVGINTEFNEKMSALSDHLMKLVYVKYKAKGFTTANAPRFSLFNNVIPMGLNQDLLPLLENINPAAFEGFLRRQEDMMLTIAGLSRLVMGAIPPGSDTSGEALANLLHASISRLEVVRTPIQWCWTSLFDEIWVPLLRKWGKVSSFSGGREKSVAVKELFDGFTHVEWIWPDVTPRDALRSAELALNQLRAGVLSRETTMKRGQVPSPQDEMQAIKEERQDIIASPEHVINTLRAEMMARNMEQQALMSEQAMQQAQMTDAQASDMNMKGQAAATPALSQEDNATPPGTPSNAIQGIQQPPPEAVQ